MDTPSISTEIVIILLLIIANGVFALTEMAVVSSRKSRLEQMAARGSKGARKALELTENPNQLLSAVQIGITLIGIMTGAFGGAKLSGYLASFFRTVPVLAPYSNAVSMALVVSGITYFSLVIGELVPKRIALNNPEPIAVFIARPISFFVRLNRPLVQLLSVSTQFALAVLRAKPPDEPPVTEEEVRVLIGQGAQHGVFEEAEREMVEKIFLLSDMRAGALMTPRTQISWLDLEDTYQSNLDIIIGAEHSCFPVGRGDLDDVIGVVYTKDMLADHLAGKQLDLEKSARQPLYVPKSLHALKVLELFKKESARVALVIDEFGGIAGLVTLNDILEHIVGEIPDGDDPGEPEAIQREDGSWLLDGMLPVDEFKRLFGLEELPEEERANYQTLGGFVISYLGYIPKASEVFQWSWLKFEVLDMDGTRVDKLLVIKLPHEVVAEETYE